jgi:hypothetical protein
MVSATELMLVFLQKQNINYMKTKDVSYRIAYKSDHLGVIDLEEMLENGQSLIVTINEVWHEQGAVVAGSKGNFNIAYFNESIKPLVLNATNAATIRRLCNGGANLNTWKMPVTVELYIDATVKMKGQIVGGVRVRKALNVAPQLDASSALNVLSGAISLEDLKERYMSLSKAEQGLSVVVAKKDEMKTLLS